MTVVPNRVIHERHMPEYVRSKAAHEILSKLREWIIDIYLL